jgi:hypothetical protein
MILPDMIVSIHRFATILSYLKGEKQNPLFSFNLHRTIYPNSCFAKGFYTQLSPAAVICY